ncbi:MAG: DUF6456 domain-containing protein [Sphingomonadaceae bacterium]|uniref:DUF6456 domain-containing protein n=1 Tax=Thermaurantiacus sp. TaxID=2820283 RepID=UPI00298EFF54|nr:DUF6456 domain-containing protein [Thermaurantiacus sp.]MCS6987757.1 DUF6456 domain-containing protein [Sphingomonadaceae bacterium]MDW8415023.1 DUF6456 domain-containing protein [Thermaurantiacus sp.]
MIDPKDYPNRVLARRRLAPADAVGRQVVFENERESPLTWLHRRGMLTDRQYAAGERLVKTFHEAGLAGRVTMRWDAVPADGAAGPWGADRSVLGRMDARRRFHEAMDAVGPGLSDILWRVVCAGEGLATAERALGWPVRSGKLVLGIALDRLAAHYDGRSGKNHLDKRNAMG